MAQELEAFLGFLTLGRQGPAGPHPWGCPPIFVLNDENGLTMKATYTLPLLALAFLAFGPMQAQTVPLTLTNADGEVVNGTTIHLSAEVAGMMQEIDMGLIAENTSGTERLMNVKRYETNVLHGTKNYFCWDLCYGERNAGVSPLWIGSDPIPMAAGDFANGFHAYYKPMGIVGPSTFLYVWYDMDSPNDSTWVEFIFEATEAVGVAEIGQVRGFTAYPNPSMGGIITFDYELSAITPGVELAFYNMLGERKLVKTLTAAQGRLALNDDELGNGIWFAVLERQGKTLATKRLVVAR